MTEAPLGDRASGAGGNGAPPGACVFTSGPRVDGPRQEPRVIRSHRERRTSRRNLLSDFDTLVERALVASEEGRDPEPFVADAIRLARELAGPCCSDDPDHLVRVVNRNAAEEHVRSGIAAAIRRLDKLEVRKSEKLASAVKYFVRSVACACTRPALSRSGREVW